MAISTLLGFFAKGGAIGLSIAAPVGPIGVLCIRRTLAHGRLGGLACGLGAATADAMYGGIAGFGLTAISNFLVSQAFWLNLGGGLFLCFLGVQTMRRAPVAEATQPAAQSGARPGIQDLGPAYASTLLLTLTNPMTILSFVAVFAGFGLAASPSYRAASALVAGVFLGSVLWWLFLTAAVARVRQRVSDAWMRAINRASGGVILTFGLYALRTLISR
jgi:threonine/homoserine/homoserine lactone efflux protein